MENGGGGKSKSIEVKSGIKPVQQRDNRREGRAGETSKSPRKNGWKARRGGIIRKTAKPPTICRTFRLNIIQVNITKYRGGQEVQQLTHGHPICLAWRPSRCLLSRLCFQTRIEQATNFRAPFLLCTTTYTPPPHGGGGGGLVIVEPGGPRAGARSGLGLRVILCRLSRCSVPAQGSPGSAQDRAAPCSRLGS